MSQSKKRWQDGGSLQFTAVGFVQHEATEPRSEILMEMKKKMCIRNELVGEGREG